MLRAECWKGGGKGCGAVFNLRIIVNHESGFFLSHEKSKCILRLYWERYFQ